jgi:hypothetical protein
VPARPHLFFVLVNCSGQLVPGVCLHGAQVRLQLGGVSDDIT